MCITWNFEWKACGDVRLHDSDVMQYCWRRRIWRACEQEIKVIVKKGICPECRATEDAIVEQKFEGRMGGVSLLDKDRGGSFSDIERMSQK